MAVCLHSRPVFDRIDHIGVAVADLDGAIELYRDRLGMPLQHRETVEQFGVEAALLGIGDSHVELLSPTDPESAVGRFIERGGPGPAPCGLPDRRHRRRARAGCARRAFS